MPQADVEAADPLFQLVTDALRAGPGSPEWHQAVAKVREGGDSLGANADEYKLLIAAREHLESGKDYRSVRAGPGFTRKLLKNLDDDGTAGKGPRPGLPTATIVAILSGLGILAVLISVAVKVIPRGGGDPGKPTPDDLQNAYFPITVASAPFDGPDALKAATAAGWKTLGQLNLESTPAGLRPAATGGAPATAATGAAVLSPERVAADEPFAGEVRLLLNKPSDDVTVEVFVSTAASDGDFSPDRATSANELVWSLRGSRQQVITGEAQTKAEAARPEAAKGEKTTPLTVRVLVNRDVAVVESNSQRLWAGPHGLPAAPRRVGVRFLKPAGPAKSSDPATVQAIKVLKK